MSDKPSDFDGYSQHDLVDAVLLARADRETAQLQQAYLHELVKGAVSSLMLADNLGDVHDVLNQLLPGIGLETLEGSYGDGWTMEDCEMVGIDTEEDIG